MTRLKTFLAVVLLATTLAPVSAALATAEPEPVPATIAEPTDPSLQPAVMVDDAAEAPEDLAWTFRFLVPLLLVIAAAGVLVTLLMYGVRVRGRYRVVR